MLGLPKGVSGVMLPWLLEELKRDGGEDRHDTQHTHPGRAKQEKAFLGGVISGNSSIRLGDVTVS